MSNVSENSLCERHALAEKLRWIGFTFHCTPHSSTPHPGKHNAITHPGSMGLYPAYRLPAFPFSPISCRMGCSRIFAPKEMNYSTRLTPTFKVSMDTIHTGHRHRHIQPFQ